MNLKYKLVLLTMMLPLFMTASAEEGSQACLFPAPPTLPEMLIPPDDPDFPQCANGKIVSDLKFIINDVVVGEEWLLDPPVFPVAGYLEIKLQENLRACSRYHDVDLWIAIEIPNGTHLFLVSGPLGPKLSIHPVPFKTGIGSGKNAHSVYSLEIPPGMGGEYHFYAGYTLPGKDISDFLFTLRSNRAAVKVILHNS
jgi:hypothetical protein